MAQAADALDFLNAGGAGRQPAQHRDVKPSNLLLYGDTLKVGDFGLARPLVNAGDLLPLDEPMAGVEGAAYETMQRVVRQEAQSGRAVCVVEHNVSFIRDLCSRAVFMAQGKILQDGTVEELIASTVLTELYFAV